MSNKSKPAPVVYSFSGRWESALRSKKVTVFFRKRRPVVVPPRVFFYVGVPVKSIIGFASVKFIEQVGLREAIKYKDAGCITELELNKYIGNDGSVHAIHIEHAVIFEKAIDLEDIKEAFGFNPPQSFSNVSDSFERRLTESGS